MASWGRGRGAHGIKRPGRRWACETLLAPCQEACRFPNGRLAGGHSAEPLHPRDCLAPGGGPKRLRIILEGESLLNDASGLTLFEIFFHQVRVRRSATRGPGLIVAKHAMSPVVPPRAVRLRHVRC